MRRAVRNFFLLEAARKNYRAAIHKAVTETSVNFSKDVCTELGLSTSDDESLAKVNTLATPYFSTNASTEHHRNYVFDSFVLPLTISLFFFTPVILVVLNWLQLQSVNLGDWISTPFVQWLKPLIMLIGLYLLVSLAIFVVIVLPLWVINSRPRFVMTMAVVPQLALLAWIWFSEWSMIALNTGDSVFRWMLAATAVSLFAFSVAMSCLVVTASVFAVIRRKRLSEIPLSRTLYGLAVLLNDRYSESRRRLDTPLLRVTLERLELAAKPFDSDLSELHRSGDPATDAWFRQQCARKAAAIRSLKSWLLQPRHDTLDHFDTRIREILRALIDRRFDDLPNARPPTITTKSRIHTIFGTILRIAIVAVPLIGVLIYEKFSGTPLPADVRGYLFSAAGLWTLANLLPFIDPNYAKRISEASESVGHLLPGLRKNS